MSWSTFFEKESQKEYYKKIEEFIEVEYNKTTVYPTRENIFKAFELCELDEVKVVIIGQDPYHGENQAMGLAFSVPQSQKIPPSLVNIFKEIKREYEVVNDHGDLTSWAKQGVLLLNTVLTVEAKKPNSHKNCGWQTLIDNAIIEINQSENNVVFLLWGNNAKSKAKLITNKSHLVLESSHPSPLGAYRGFNGCNHFKLANEFLISKNRVTINWKN